MDVDEPLKRLANPKNLVDRIERNARNGRAGASADALQGDELFQSLGDQYAGRFISPSKESQSSEPTDAGFTGAFHSGDGEVFPEGNVIIGGVEEGALNAGITDKGRLIINSVTLNGTELDAGLIRNEAGYITEQNVDNGSEDRTMRIGMIDNGTYAEGRIEFNEPSSSSVTVPNGDFAANDMSDWDVNAGTWDASAGYAVGTASSPTKPSIKNTAMIAVTAGNTYNFSGQFSASCLGTYGTATTFTVVTKLDVKFYTAGDALVSTVTVGTRTGSQAYATPAELSQGGASLGWGSITKNILVPATATKFEYVAYINSFSGDSCTLSVDDFTCVQVAAQSALVFQDGKIIYEKSDGTEFEIKKSLEEVSIKTANESFDNTTPTNVTDMLWTIPANTIHWFNLTVKITTATAGGTMDAQLSFTLPSGAVIAWGAMAGSVSDMEVVSSAFTPNNAATGALTIGLDSNKTSIFRFGGFITTSSTAGTVQLQARQNTSNANTFQIDKASFIKYTDLSGANLTSPAYYSDTEAQDAVGGLLTDTATINLTYTPNTSITADVIDGSITEAKMEMATAASTSKVIGWTGAALDWIAVQASHISDFSTTVRATVLTGLSLADSTDVTAADTALQAFGKLQAQIDGLPTAGDISGTGVVGQLAEFVTNTKTLQAAKIIAPPTHILTLTTTAASTLALNITAAKTLTLTAADNYTLTIPATMTAAGLGVANVFTANQKIDGSADAIQLLVEGHSTQTNPIFKIQKSDGTLLYTVENSGAHIIETAVNTDDAFVVRQIGGLATFHVNTRTLKFGINTETAGSVLTVNLTSTGMGGGVRVQQNATTSYGDAETYFQGVGQSAVAESRKLGFLFVDLSSTGASCRVYAKTPNTMYFDVGAYNESPTNTVLTININGLATHFSNTTTTNAVLETMKLQATVSTASTGATAGFGVAQTMYAETATNGTSKQQGRLWSKWIVATNGSETSAVGLDAYTNSTAQEFISGEGNGSGVKLALYGGTRVARAAAMTAPDANTINSGDATTDAIIENMRTRINELAAMVNSTTGINICA